MFKYLSHTNVDFHDHCLIMWLPDKAFIKCFTWLPSCLLISLIYGGKGMNFGSRHMFQSKFHQLLVMQS